MIIVRQSTFCIAAWVLFGCASGSSNLAGVTPTPDTPTPPWTLAWSDEFDGPAGSSFDATKWVAETGGSGWGNQEREFYTTPAMASRIVLPVVPSSP